MWKHANEIFDVYIYNPRFTSGCWYVQVLWRHPDTKIFIKKVIGNLKKAFLTLHCCEILCKRKKHVDYQYAAFFTSYLYRKHEHKVDKR
jgi:hypothetical protein